MAMTLHDPLADLLLVMMIFEYGFAVLCFICGYYGVLKLAQAIQALFVTVEIAIEVRLYKKIGKPLQTNGQDDVLKTICGISVAHKGILLWVWYLITFAPNYVQVQASSALAGTTFAPWFSTAFQSARAQFATNWNRVPVVGSLIGELGIPILVAAILVFSCCFHIGFALLIRRFDVGNWKQSAVENRVVFSLCEYCDLANLQFLSACFRNKCLWNEYLGEQVYGRLWAVVCVKMPLLWMKISWLSVALCYIVVHGETFTTAWAVATGWYSVLQLMPNFSRSVRKSLDLNDCLCISLPFFILVLLVLHQMLHMSGVWLCPSRELSVFAGGCAPLHNNTNLTCD